MKKTNFFYAATIALVSAFGMTSCSVEDNPAPNPTEPGKQEPAIVQISLQDVPFYDCEGTYGKDAKKDKTAGFAWALNESTGLPYGDGNVINFADLSEYSKLLVVATEGTPRFLLNRDIENGQWNADESQSHLIEYPKGDDVWSAKYFSVLKTGMMMETIGCLFNSFIVSFLPCLYHLTCLIVVVCSDNTYHDDQYYVAFSPVKKVRFIIALMDIHPSITFSN